VQQDGDALKAVILAGGYGTRLLEETELRPKPLVEVGGRPILWHILKIYASHGINDFVVCLGYKGHLVKEYFADYALRHADVTFDLARGSMEVHGAVVEPWRVTLVDTGLDTLTGGRLRRVRAHVRDDEAFCMTYGDGVGDVDVAASIAFHRAQGAVATVTVVPPPGRYGIVALDGDRVRSFREKQTSDDAWINGGFFVLSPRVFDYLPEEDVMWEHEPLERLAADGQLAAYRHPGHWQCMDTLRDKRALEAAWNSGAAPWKVW
jgi:glucose-1-phosphate cytidylyltransferase